MKFDTKQYLDKLQPTIDFIRRYLSFGFIIVLLLTYSFLVYRVNVFTRAEPTDAQVSDKLKTVQRPHIDQTTINKIQDLQVQNVQVQALFNSARNNPFSEQ